MPKAVIRYNVHIDRINRPFIAYDLAEQQRRDEAGENEPFGYYEESEEQQSLSMATMSESRASDSDRGHSYPVYILTATAEDGTTVSVASESPMWFDDNGALKMTGHRWTVTGRDYSIQETWTITPA